MTSPLYLSPNLVWRLANQGAQAWVDFTLQLWQSNGEPDMRKWLQAAGLKPLRPSSHDGAPGQLWLLGSGELFFTRDDGCGIASHPLAN